MVPIISKTMTFSDLIETVKDLSIDEKQELQMLLQQYLREERREEIHENFKLAQAEEQSGKLKYSSDINELKRLILDESDCTVEG
jgi:hypothetical protein